MLEIPFVARDQCQSVRERRGRQQTVDGRQRAPRLSHQTSPAIRDGFVDGQHAAAEEPGKLNFQPVQITAFSFALRHQFDAFAKLAHRQCG